MSEDVSKDVKPDTNLPPLLPAAASVSASPGSLVAEDLGPFIHRRQTKKTWLTPALIAGLLLGIGIVAFFLQTWPGFRHRPLASYFSSLPRSTVQQPPTPSRSLEPLQQIASYLSELKGGRSFDENETGEEIGRALGYTSKLLESAYDELAHFAEVRLQRAGTLSIDEVIEYLEEILREEHALKKISDRRDARTVASVTYLRALQYGKAAFPNPALSKPSATELLTELSEAFPNNRIDLNDVIFAEVYAKALHLAEESMRQTGSFSIYDIIGEFRRNLVQNEALNK